MKKSIIACAIFFGWWGQINAEVGSSKYQFMLQKLLDHSVPEMSAKELLNSSKDYVLLDAREPREYEVSHLEGAKFVGYDQYDDAQIKTLSKETPIVVYCSVGYRSEKIAEKLLSQGFTNVKNLYGGIFEWVNENGQIVNKNGPTEQVHAYSRTWGVWLRKGKKVYK